MAGYSGYDKPYIYVFCSETDGAAAEKVIAALAAENVLFRKNEKTELNRKERMRIRAAYAVLLFVSEDSLGQKRFRDIVDEAVRAGKRILTVYLGNTVPMKDAWGRMQLDSAQAVFRKEFASEEAFTAKIKEAEIFKKMAVTAEQKKYQRRRGFLLVAIPVAAAAVLYFTVLDPLLIQPAKQREARQQELGIAGLSQEELDKIEELRMSGKEKFGDEVSELRVWYDNGAHKPMMQVCYASGETEQRELGETGTIRDLTELRLLRNLEELSMNSQQIRDLSPLYPMKSIRRLHLECNPIDSLEGIGEMENLEDLRLTNTRVSDLTPLIPLEHLQVLHLSGCPVSTVPQLACIKNGTLKSLQLDATLVTDLPYLGKLSNLSLALQNLPELPHDFSFLKDVENFDKLSMDGPVISEFMPVIRGKEIRRLSAAGSDIRAVSELTGLKGLEELDLCHSYSLNSLEGVEEFRKLKYLDIKDCPLIRDFTPVLKLPALECLALSDTQKEEAERQLAGMQIRFEYWDQEDRRIED